jgi:phosphonate metabolism-associated iron-containing alcohol dehydrogenase
MRPIFSFHAPVEVLCGPGVTQRLPEMLAGRSVVLLLHPNAEAGGARTQLEGLLGERLLLSLSHSDGLPTLSGALELCRSVWDAIDGQGGARPGARAPVIVAFGGGATIDLAKAICHRPVDRAVEALSDWIRGHSAAPAWEPIDLIALPTTAGTGSEVTCWATLWDMNDNDSGNGSSSAQSGVKRSLESPIGFPKLAIVDPQSTLSCPDAVTRDSGLDALAHALEAIWNRHASPVTDALAVSAAQRIIVTLPALLDAPDSIAHRQSMSEAALMAGLAFSQTRTALAHALSYPLTIEQGVPHGLACAVWLPTAWMRAAGRDASRDRLLRSIFGQSSAALESLTAWLQGLGVPELTNFVPAAQCEERIRAALEHPRGRNFIGAP